MDVTGHTLKDLPLIGLLFGWVCSCGEVSDFPLHTVDDAMAGHRIHSDASCACPWVDAKYWTTHYGAVEPGSQREFNPDCPVHRLERAEAAGI